MKVVMDTDTLVAALRSPDGASRLWLRSILAGEVTALLSVPLMLQYEAVITRPEHLHECGLSTQDVGRILDALCKVGRPLNISYLWRPILKDPDDEMVLEAAVQGGADVLLTFNEKDFRNASTFQIQIMRPGPAWAARQTGEL